MKITKKQRKDLEELKESRQKVIKGLKKGIKNGAPTEVILQGLLGVIEVGDQVAEWEAVR